MVFNKTVFKRALNRLQEDKLTSLCEFNDEAIIKERGLTSLEAVMFLKKFDPSATWSIWNVNSYRCSYSDALRHFVALQNPGDKTGQVGNWKWERIPCDYPEYLIWNGLSGIPNYRWWTGLVQVTGAEGESFRLFSFTDSAGSLGMYYGVDNLNEKLLLQFSKEIDCILFPKGEGIEVACWGDDNFNMPKGKEYVLLEPAVLNDIEMQVKAFYASKAIYEKLDAPYRRGFLFVGSPGNGKTLLVRHLIRKVHHEHEGKAYVLASNARTTEWDLAAVLGAACDPNENKVPGLVILEDMDSLTRETQVTRAGILNKMDGVNPKAGCLIIATTNNPGAIDPALVDRPSRFDRVWKFQLPNKDMRRQYMNWALGKLELKEEAQLINKIVQKTADWSFAYLNELRITAAMLAVHDNRDTVIQADVYRSLELLGAQFKSAQKEHTEEERESGGVGFKYNEPEISSPDKNKVGFGN